MATDLLKSYDKVAVPIKPQERQDLPPMQAVSWWGARDMRVTETPRPAITHPVGRSVRQGLRTRRTRTGLSPLSPAALAG